MALLQCMQVGAHEVLADLLMRYMAELSSTSHSYAELAGRTATNISDVVCCSTHTAASRLASPDRELIVRIPSQLGCLQV